MKGMDYHTKNDEEDAVLFSEPKRHVTSASFKLPICHVLPKRICTEDAKLRRYFVSNIKTMKCEG